MLTSGYTASTISRATCLARGALPAAGALVALCLCPVQAQTQQKSAGAANPCAVYGSGFVAVQGTGSCVRIGGRVRLELNMGSVGHAYAPGGPNTSPAAAPFGAQTGGINRAQVRLDGGRGQR